MNKFLLLTAPPASGKTYWIESFYQELGEKILVISPLKALALELEEKWQGAIEVCTAEAYLISPKPARVVIFDEWHLLFYWGDSFRDSMWQAFFELTSQAELSIGLTATLNDEILHSIKEWRHFDELWWIDQGNQTLKYWPQKITRFYQKSWHQQFILQQSPLKTQIIFCQFRQEVEQWLGLLATHGHSALGCVGGETREFSQKLKRVKPQFIVATTCLSHGVNLPLIEAVHFVYKVDNLDFWIQMSARGGRDGSGYQVFCSWLLPQVKLNFWTNLWRNSKLIIWTKCGQMILGLDQWFLKASSSEKLPIRSET